MSTLIYTSVANERWTDEALKVLLEKARLKNAQHEVTGMLLYLDPYFIQVLEGEEPMVVDLYDRIRSDKRHHKVSLLYLKPTTQRLFGEWSMGFSMTNSETVQSLEGFSDFLQKPLSEFLVQAPHRVLELLNLFKRELLF